MAERKTRAEKQQEQATAAILAAMTRRAINGDTRAARIVLGEKKRISIETPDFSALEAAFADMKIEGE